MNWFSDLSPGRSESATPEWDQDALLIDVRSPFEYASGFVQGALNLPLDRFLQDYASSAPDKSRQIVLYCRSGARSGQAAQFLLQQNYQNVINGGSVATVAVRTGRPIQRQ